MFFIVSFVLSVSVVLKLSLFFLFLGGGVMFNVVNVF